jgi:hypothetical protein
MWHGERYVEAAYRALQIRTVAQLDQDPDSPAMVVGVGALCETERMSRKALPCNSGGNSAAMSRSRNPLERRGIKRGRSRTCCGECDADLSHLCPGKGRSHSADPRRSLIAPMTAQQSRTPKSFRRGKRSRFGSRPPCRSSRPRGLRDALPVGLSQWPDFSGPH